MRDITEPALVWTGKVMLDGRVAIPPLINAAVILATAPSLMDPNRDLLLIGELHRIGVASVSVPLLTEDELQFDSRTAHFRYDADFLAQRYLDVAQWLHRNRDMTSTPLGLIGTSGAAAGALVAAALRPDLVNAVISIDGRTDLAVEMLRDVKAPTLLLVNDMPVLRMNREALVKLRGEKRLEVVRADVELLVQKAAHWLEDKLSTRSLSESVPAAVPPVASA